MNAIGAEVVRLCGRLQTHTLVLSAAREALQVSVEEAAAVVAEIRRMESLMPVVDPTGYRRIAGNLPGHLEVCEAFLEFRRRLAAALAEEPQEGES